MTAEAPSSGPPAWRRRLWLGLGACIITLQALLGLVGVDDAFTRGHNGWNSSAYLLSARNSLRWGSVLPHQYYTEPRPPPPQSAYTHAPLALHLHNVAAVWLLGDRPAAVRGVAALHGVLAVWALLVVVSRLWSPWHGLVAAAIYACLPLNAIYVNMANHSSGLIFWSLWMLYAYTRFRETAERRWLAGLLGASLMATSWDWPAYYLALFMAVHWFVTEVHARLFIRAEPPRRTFVVPFVAFCAWILAMAGGLLAVFYLGSGSLQDMAKTFEARQQASEGSYARIVEVIPELLFTWPILAAVGVWLGVVLVRIARRRMLGRDLIPLAFALAGVVHAVIFKSSAVVHEYWLWPLLPGVAIAVAEVVLWLLGIRRHRALRLVAVAIALAVPGFLVYRFAELVPSARYVGGSLWFISNVRGDHPSAYDSGRAELRFAEKVRAWTDRSTGVMLHRGLERFVPERRFEVTLDRALRRVSGARPQPLPLTEGITGWVLVGDRADFAEPALAQAAGDHPLVLYDHFFMIDYRRRERSVEAYALALGERTLGWTLFYSPFERPELEARDEAAERTLAEARAR